MVRQATGMQSLRLLACRLQAANPRDWLCGSCVAPSAAERAVHRSPDSPQQKPESEPLKLLSLCLLSTGIGRTI